MPSPQKDKEKEKKKKLLFLLPFLRLLCIEEDWENDFSPTVYGGKYLDRVSKSRRKAVVAAVVAALVAALVAAVAVVDVVDAALVLLV